MRPAAINNVRVTATSAINSSPRKRLCPGMGATAVTPVPEPLRKSQVGRESGGEHSERQAGKHAEKHQCGEYRPVQAETH